MGGAVELRGGEAAGAALIPQLVHHSRELLGLLAHPSERRRLGVGVLVERRLVEQVHPAQQVEKVMAGHLARLVDVEAAEAQLGPPRARAAQQPRHTAH